ncbi:40S ribosomal protein S13 [Vitis vinifera]|uniref:40S ribosomal protein S13 n=1 Tax=Vitis vinifera TaxID=29760 RepID=A0A438IWY4_VITVI|nr:40S ribosomal protein S13 [Vitis vinifera]
MENSSSLPFLEAPLNLQTNLSKTPLYLIYAFGPEVVVVACFFLFSHMYPFDVEENICKFAKKGMTPSQIGVILRDSHGIAQVKSVTGSKILRILKAHGLAPEIPEDLYHLIKKAVAIRKHLERNRKDKDSKFRLILVESRIHRLARYYKRTKKLPPVWK